MNHPNQPRLLGPHRMKAADRSTQMETIYVRVDDIDYIIGISHDHEQHLEQSVSPPKTTNFMKKS